METILVTDDVHPILLAELQNAGYEIDYKPDISLESVRKIIKQYYGIIINSKIKMDKEMFLSAKKLKFIGRLGSGLDIIDLEEAKHRKVDVYSAPEGNRNAVGEHAMGMLLSLLNNLCRSDREVRNQIWNREKNRGMELMGKTVGIIGYGNTGSRFVKKLSGFDVNVLIYDKYKNHYVKDLRYAQETDLLTIQSQADIISFHIPLTSETNQLINKEFLSKCKKGVILINTARGKIASLSDIVESLETGQLGGACLDVFENEKPYTFSKSEAKIYQRLYQMDNVILSPHVAGWTIESKEKIARVLINKILKKWNSET